MGVSAYGRSEVQRQLDAPDPGGRDPLSFPQPSQHLEPHTSGKKQPRGPQGSEGLQAVSQVADLYEHPQVDDDLERMPAKNVDNYHARVAELRSGQRHPSTHPLNGPLKGWQGTSLGGNQFRMIHRFNQGALEVVAAGNHTPAYDTAIRRKRSLGLHTAMGQAGPDYDNLSFRHGDHPLYPSEGMEYQTIFAHHPEHGDIGRLHYREMDHPAWTGLPEHAVHVTMMHVEPEHRRRGVADQLMQHLEETHPNVPIDHGSRRPDGNEWAKSHYNDPKGGQYHPFHGEYEGGKSSWTLNGKPWNVETKKHYRMPKQTARFTPTKRVFTHTDGLDHRLWDADGHLKPEVRSYVMGTIAAWWGPIYKNWSRWANVFFSGSEASEWTSEILEGNSDFDVLIGVDYSKFREDNPKYKDWSNQEITDEMNQGFRHHNGEVMLDIDGIHTGPWDRTTYVNVGWDDSGTYDLRKIKPYSAYNISEDRWLVKPPHLPHWSLSELPRAIQAVLRAASSYALHVLKLPEPERTQQGAALFDAWHSDRSRAFSDRGEGWWDIGNLREKWGDQQGWWAEIVNCKHRSTEGLDLAPADWSNTPKGYTAKTAAESGFAEGNRFAERLDKSPEEEPYIVPRFSEYAKDHVAGARTYRLLHNVGAFGGSHVTAHQKLSNGKYRGVGYLSWFPGKPTYNSSNIDGGVIHKVQVSAQHRRRGLASAMLDFARERRPDMDIRHSNALTDDGRAWAEKKASLEGLNFRHGGPDELPDDYPFRGTLHET